MAGKVQTMLLIMGIAFLLFGGIMLLWTWLRSEKYTVTEAEVVSSMFSDSTDMRELIVRFQVDGNTVTHGTQPVKDGKVRYRAGDKIRICYARKRTLGMDAWRIYVDDDAERSARRARRLNTLAGGAFVLTGIAMLVVSVVMRRIK